jgi:MFS family permease
MVITMGVIMTAFPLFLNDELYMAVPVIGIVMAIRTVAFIITTFSGGHVIERLGSKISAIVGILIEASTLLLYPLIRNPNHVFPLAFIGGLGSGLFQISLALLMSLQMEEQFVGSGVGIYRTFQDTGSVIGPILIMLIAEATGIRSTFMVGLTAYLISIPLVLLTKKSK